MWTLSSLNSINFGIATRYDEAYLNSLAFIFQLNSKKYIIFSFGRHLSVTTYHRLMYTHIYDVHCWSSATMSWPRMTSRHMCFSCYVVPSWRHADIFHIVLRRLILYLYFIYIQKCQYAMHDNNVISPICLVLVPLSKKLKNYM